MKLRTRLSLCAVLLVMAAVAACCALVLRFAWADASDAALEEARADMERFCTAMRAACREEAGESPLVRRSRVLYAFRSTPGSQEYTLLLGTEYLSNNAGFAPEPLLERGHALTPDGAERYRAVRVGGARYLLLRRSLELGAQEYSLCLVRDVSGLSARIAALATRCAAAGAAVFLIAGLLLWRIVSRALRPVEQLRAGASALARGEYGRRIALRGRDELAGLAADFNAMADAIETNVAALRERAERQQAFIGDLAHEMKTPVTSILLNAELLGRPVAPAAAEAALARIADQGRWLERLSQKLTALVLLGQDIKRREGSVAELFEAVRAATEDALRARHGACALLRHGHAADGFRPAARGAGQPGGERAAGQPGRADDHPRRARRRDRGHRPRPGHPRRGARARHGAVLHGGPLAQQALWRQRPRAGAGEENRRGARGGAVP